MRKQTITHTLTPTRQEYKQHSNAQLTNKSSSLISSRKFYDLDYIFQEPSIQLFSYRSARVSAAKTRTIDTCTKELEKSQLVYKNMMVNLQMDCLFSKQLPRHHPVIALNQKAQVIHSRKSSRHSFTQRKTIKPRSTSQTSRGDSTSRTMNQSRTIDPESNAAILPQAKTMKLSLKSESVPRIDTREEQLLFCKQPVKSQPQSPKRKFWAKTYRPWSPLKRSALGAEEFSTFQQFVQIN